MVARSLNLGNDILDDVGHPRLDDGHKVVVAHHIALLLAGGTGDADSLGAFLLGYGAVGCVAVVHFEHLRGLQGYSNRENILVDVGRTDGNGCYMAHHLILDDAQVGGGSTKVNDYNARLLLLVGGSHRGTCYRAGGVVDVLDAAAFEGFGYALESLLTGQHKTKRGLQAGAKSAHRGADGLIGVDLVALGDACDDNLAVGGLNIGHVVVEFVHIAGGHFAVGSAHIDKARVGGLNHMFARDAYPHLRGLHLVAHLQLAHSLTNGCCHQLDVGHLSPCETLHGAGNGVHHNGLSLHGEHTEGRSNFAAAQIY